MIELPRIPQHYNPRNMSENALYDYLFRLERGIRNVIADITDNTEKQIAVRARTLGESEIISDMRDSIIKTADEIRTLRESINMQLVNNYVSKNEVAEYAETAVQNIELDGKGITQYFNEISVLAERLSTAESNISDSADDNTELALRVAEINAYIRTGRLESGVYGIEIGNFHDGNTSPFKVRLSDNRLAFYVGNTEVAYFSNNSMMVANTGVLNSLTIGDCVISPDDGITFVCNK